LTLKVYSVGKHHGDVQYESIPVGIELPRDTGGRQLINVGIKRHRVRGAAVNKVLLAVKVSSNEPLSNGVRWKISLNGVVISRLYKPFEEAKIGGRWMGYQVYDATPVVASRLRNRIQKIGIVYPGGYDVTVENIDVLVNIGTNSVDAHGYHEFRTGIHILEPGETLVFNPISPPRDEGNGEIVSLQRLLLFIPNRQARFTISSGDIHRVVTGRSGLVDVTLEGTSVFEEPCLVSYEAPPGVYPREGAVLSHFRTWQYYRGPRILVEKITCECKEKSEISISLRNSGSQPPESMQVILFNAGVLVKRVGLKPLKPSEAREVRLEGVRVVDEKAPLLVRVLWNWLSRYDYTETEVYPS